jgi:hypothetical protein
LVYRCHKDTPLQIGPSIHGKPTAIDEIDGLRKSRPRGVTCLKFE